MQASASRRKVTTYGKTASRRVEGFNRENERPLSSTYNATKPSSKEIQESAKSNPAALKHPARRPENVNPAEVLQERQSSLVLKRGGTEAAHVAAEVDHHDQAWRVAEQQHQRRPVPFPRGGGGLDVFDVPTSDEETSARQSAKKGRSPGPAKHGRARREPRSAHGKAQSSVPSEPHLRKQASYVVRSKSGSNLKTLPVRKEASVTPVVDDRTLQQQIALQMSAEDATMKLVDDEGMRSGPSMAASPESLARSQESPDEMSDGLRRKSKPKHAGINKVIGTETRKIVNQKPTAAIRGVAGVSTDDEIPKTLKRPSPDCFEFPSTDEEHDRDLGRTSLAAPLRTPSPRKRARVLHHTSSPSAEDDSHVEANHHKQSNTRTYSPRHAKLWDQLLHGNDPPADSPSAIPLEGLGLSSTTQKRWAGHRPSSSSALKFPDIGAGEPGNRKRRLIDALVGTSDTKDVNLQSESESDGEAATSPTLRAVALPPSSQSASQEAAPGISSSQTTANHSTVDSHVTSSQSAATSQSTGLKVTYSRQRSYLTEASLEEAVLPSVSEEPSNRATYTARRGASQRALVPVMSMGSSWDVPEDEPSNGGSLRSIHELRAAGGNKRFLDEFEGMLEDISTDGAISLSRRRASLLELALKLSKTQNAHRFIELGLERRLFAAVGSTRDLIADFAVASLIVLLGRQGLPSHSTTQIYQRDIFQLLTELLAIDRDVVAVGKERTLHLSRVSQSLVSDVVPLLLHQSDGWPAPPDYISPRIVALSALDVIMGGLRDGKGGGGDLSQALPSGTAATIMTILSQTFDWSVDHPPAAQKSLEIEMSLSFLEACTMRPEFQFGGPAEDVAWTQMITELLLYVCRDDSTHARRIQSSVLRLFLNITNHRSSLTESIGTAQVAVALTGVITSGFSRHDNDVDEESDEQVCSVDDLILGLAALINLVESSMTMRAHLLEHKTHGIRLLDALLRPFLLGLRKTSEADSMEGTHFNVAFGYLAVLLSNISLHPGARSHLCAKLPGRTLSPVTDAAIEFLQYHQQVDSQLSEAADGGDGGEGPRDGFTERLQRMIHRLTDAEP